MKSSLARILPACSLSLLMLALPAWAHAQPGAQCMHGHQSHAKMMHRDHAGKFSDAERKAMHLRHAQSIDMNKDGVITASEIIAMQERKRRQHLEARLAKADSNSDGKVSVEEFTRAHGQMMHRHHGTADSQNDDANAARKGPKRFY